MIAGSGLDAPLAADDGSTTTPWHEAVAGGEPVAVRVDDLPGLLWLAAAAQGYRGVLLVAPADRGGPQACLVLRRAADEEPDFTCRLMLDNLVRITGMVLEREQDAADLRHAASHDVLTGLANRVGFRATGRGGRRRSLGTARRLVWTGAPAVGATTPPTPSSWAWTSTS